jgi:hypothetical protein
MASRAERYSLAIMGMRPFVSPFSRMQQKFIGKDSHVKRHMNSDTKLSFIMWQLVSRLCYDHPTHFAVPLYFLRHQYDPEYLLYSDSSWDGVGVAIFDANHILIVYTQFAFPFCTPEFKASALPNAREYVGYFLCLFLIYTHFPVKIHINIMYTHYWLELMA